MEKNRRVNSKINAALGQTENAKLLRLATYASVLTAAILIFAKLTAWMLTGSISVLASLVDSLMDIIASIINLFAVRYSLQPADAEHRFGHGKAEPLAGLAQAAFITGSAVFLILHAVERLRFPHELQDTGIGIAVMVLAIGLTLGLLLIQRYVIKRTASTAIRADALHYGTDLLTNLSIIFALILASFGWIWADAVFAVAVAIYIFYSALRIGYEAFQQLMDRELPAEVHEQILSIARQNPAVLGAHGLRTRQSGQAKFIQLHLELDDNLSLFDAHAIGDQVEHNILAILPEAEIIIHQDPASLKDRPRRNLTYE